MRFSQIVLAASSAALSNAVIITNDASVKNGLAVGVPVAITFGQSVGPTQLYETTGSGNNVDNVNRKAVGGPVSGTSGSIVWTPTIGGSDVTLVIVDSGSGDALPTNYLGPLTVSGSSVSSSSSSSSSSSTTGSSSSSSSTASVLSSTSATMSTTVVPVNTTTLVRSSTRVYAMNSTTSATGTRSQTTITGASQTTGNGATSIPTQVNSAAGIASPLAFVFLALAALVTLN